MSTLRERLAEQLARFDEEAFVALANKGLLRRAHKDLEKYPAPVVAETPGLVTVALGEYRIQFDARGPAQARCSCPATSVCQHILAAAIFLQRATHSEAPKPQATPPESESQGVPAPHEVSAADGLAAVKAELLRISVDELVKHAGRAGYRWAWQFVQDLDPERGLTLSGDRHVVMMFERPRMRLRYLGGGLESMIADIEVAQIEKYRVAAVLAFQRANGIETPPPEPAGQARAGSLNLGQDHGPGGTDGEALADSRSRLLCSTAQIMCECTELGLSHLSRAIHERFATLAVWAQGAEYHRLALMLRRIADHIEQLLERAGGADEHRLLDELTIAYGLVSSLNHNAQQGKSPARFVGAARSRYEQAHSCELLGLGAVAWRSAAGYVGLTMLFWSPAHKEFLSCSDARPEGQGGFSPRARYKAVGPWTGLGAPALATGRRLNISGAQINAAGRLSASSNTHAALLPLDAPGQFAALLMQFSSWSEVIRSRNAARRSLLAEPQPMKDWVVLRPQRFGVAKFDAARQVLVWPVYDADDNQLNVELAYDEYTAHAIARIEAMKPSELGDGTLLVARLHSGDSGIVAEPLSLVRAQPLESGNGVDALHFDAEPEQGAVSKLLERLRSKRSSGQVSAPSAGAALPVPRFLVEYREELRRRAERGVGEDAAESQHAGKWADRAADLGFTAFKQIATTQLPAAAALLRTNYVRLQYERLIGEAADEPEFD